ncbi:MAG TPA: lysophospholipid acyltransferase family protein [Kiritimatiellia bacterium]|nr:lysophospholipid acyltransferase family protein [Kiritimatiellia bacterium]
MREALFRQPLYWLARGFVYLCLLVKYRMRVSGREHVPAHGGAIIAANHCSYLDPPVMGGANSRRVVHFLARDTLLSNPIAKWFFPRVAVIPLDRTKGDLGALKKAIGILKEGRVVGLFPEGTRSPDGRMRAAKGGIGFLIAKSEVPVVPLHISGTFAAFPKGAKKMQPSRIVARYGPAISPEEIRAAMPKKNDYEAVGALVMSRIRALAEDSSAAGSV